MELYPNPTNDVLYVKNIPTPCSYKIYDMYGKVQSTGEVMDGNSLKTNNLQSGTYLLVLEGNNVNYRRSFVKQ
ncbi:MAG: T9SS C-terminal target domain-containing protein [Flavobacteriia bacterium]|nr:T9SS C-terminal target domain-containing protein [Flavobacteriia bacterium]